MIKQAANITFISILTALFAAQAGAFSPYESLLANGRKTHVALIASAKDGKTADLDRELAALSSGKAAEALSKAGISNLSCYRKELTDLQTWYMIYFDYEGKQYLQAGADFEKAVPALADLVQPHPRATKYGRSWLQLEWINHILGADQTLPTRQKLAMVTRIKPEKEELYRTLHQSVWPGVTDQMIRSNNRNFSIFLVEIGREIYEFFYFEYVGSNFDTDNNLSKEDPCTLRWWKLTDPCQDPLPEVKIGTWAPMDCLAPAEPEKK